MTILRRKPRINGFSVKEGLDNLPSGICFADRNGTVILCNRQMYRLCRQMTGTDLQHISELLDALNAPPPQVSKTGSDAAVYRFPDGKLWQFSQSAVTDRDGNPYTQMQAMDVTELYEKRAELERENTELAKANARAKQLYAELEQIVREKETLAFKMRMHDDIGLCLLASRKLLMQGGSAEDYQKAEKRWEQTLRLYGIAEREDLAQCPTDAAAELVELTACAADIGVRMTVCGELPAFAEHAYLFIAAMRECVTNTVRHAQGDEMLVRLLQTPKQNSVVITNNGKPPQGEIAEGGGLSGLRRSVESGGGRMTVDSRPEFRLTVVLPREERIP